MVNFYIKKIIDGYMQVADVPKLWRTKVENRINEIRAAEEKIKEEDTEK